MAIIGISPRDYFAASALVALHATDDNEEQLAGMNPAARAAWAFQMADAMMAARKQKPTPEKAPVAKPKPAAKKKAAKKKP
jgi:hypothetical protein